MTSLDDLTSWVLAQLADDETSITAWSEQRLLRPDGDDRGDDEVRARLQADLETMRSLIEWAQGIEYLREVGDPNAPSEPLGEAVVRIIAERYDGRPGWREEWRL